MSELEAVRINTRISGKTNNWLDERASVLGVSKSALVNIAIEQYIEQKEMMNRVNEMSVLVAAVERLESKLEKVNLDD